MWNNEITIHPWSIDDGTFRPYFIVGCMRSGTTLLAELLGRHREIVYPPFELREIWSKVGGVPMASPKTGDSICPQLRAQDIQPGQSLRLSRAFYDVYQKNLGNKTINALFLSKNPHLCNKLFFVNQLFKESKFIWIYRHLPDVVASLKKLFSYAFEARETIHYWPEKKGSETRCWSCFFGDQLPDDTDPWRCFPGGDIKFLAEYWLENNIAVSDFFKSISSGRTLSVKEEEAISSPEAVIARCLSFMAAPLDASILDGFPIDRQRNGKWKGMLTETEQRALSNFVEQHRQEINRTFPENDLSRFYQDQIANSISEGADTASWNTRVEGEDTYVSNLKASMKEKETQIRNLEEVIRSRDVHIKNLDGKLREKEVQVANIEAFVENKNATLNYIYHSYGLGALWVCNKMVDKLFPPNTKRRSLVRLALKSIRRPKSRITDSGGSPEPSA